jgi:hypothetical protein
MASRKVITSRAAERRSRHPAHCPALKSVLIEEAPAEAPPSRPSPAASPARAKITTDGHNVTVEMDDELTGERVRTTYFCMGEYVHIRDAAGRYPQVCERLSGSGSTLRATDETLPAVIRRELRRRREAERRELGWRRGGGR